MSDQLPDRLSINPRSLHYNETILKRDVNSRFNGAKQTNVEEYCVSEKWIRFAEGMFCGGAGLATEDLYTGKDKKDKDTGSGIQSVTFSKVDSNCYTCDNALRPQTVLRN